MDNTVGYKATVNVDVAPHLESDLQYRCQLNANVYK